MLRRAAADDVVQLEAATAAVDRRQPSHKSQSFRLPSATNHTVELTQTPVSIATGGVSQTEVRRLTPLSSDIYSIRLCNILLEENASGDLDK